MVTLKYTNCQWRELGLLLGLNYFKLKEIKKNNSEVQDCMIEMLAAWLNGQGGECTKHTLRTALSEIDCEILTD